MINIDCLKHLLNFSFVHIFSEELIVTVEDFLLGEFAVAVLVDGLEDLGEVLLLALGEELAGDEGEGGLLELLVGAEGLEVGERADGDGGVDGLRAVVRDPGVLQGHLGRGALVHVVGQQLRDQVLRLVRHRRPAGVRERELPDAHLLHDLLVALPVEGGHPRQDDVQDHAARPDVALLVVLLVEDLGGDVVGRAELLVEGLGLVVDERSAEVNNLDLVEVLVLLEQDVLGLEVSAK